MRVCHFPRLSSGFRPLCAAFVLFRQPSLCFPAVGVPVRLMKRDLVFVVERLAAILDERRLAIALRQHGIGKAKSPADTPAKLLTAFVRKAEKSVLGRLLVEIVILHSTHSASDSGRVLKDAADF